MPVPYQRPAPHIKHIGGFGQSYYNRLAAASGFDGALLARPGGAIAEGAITNIAFFDETTVTWPDAPCLAGITIQLLQPRLAGSGLLTGRASVCLADLPSFTAAFITNSRGIAPAERIDTTVIRLRRAHEDGQQNLRVHPLGSHLTAGTCDHDPAATPPTRSAADPFI